MHKKKKNKNKMKNKTKTNKQTEGGTESKNVLALFIQFVKTGFVQKLVYADSVVAKKKTRRIRHDQKSAFFH